MADLLPEELALLAAAYPPQAETRNETKSESKGDAGRAAG